MSQLFGPVHQMGYVVRDIESAMRHWTETMHIGPFYCVDRVPFIKFHYKGEPRILEASIALTYSRNIQIELIQQLNDAPSAYRDFLAAGDEGLHHLGFLTEYYERDLRLAAEAGLEIEQSVAIGDPRGASTYFASNGHAGTNLKLISLYADNRDLYRMIQAEAERWDGSGPIRHIDL